MFAELLRRCLAGIVDLSPGQIEALESHYRLLVRWNKILNLTSIDRLEEVVERHYGESLFLGAHLPAGHLTIADIGSGAGFPGLPVAVLRADCAVTLVESHQRKAVFLREASRELGNVHVIAKRAEDVPERFEWGISRGVSYGDLTHTLKRLAENADLLTGPEEPPNTMGFVWDEAIRLPWSQRTCLRIGHAIQGEPFLKM